MSVKENFTYLRTDCMPVHLFNTLCGQSDTVAQSSPAPAAPARMARPVSSGDDLLRHPPTHRATIELINR